MGTYWLMNSVLYAFFWLASCGNHMKNLIIYFYIGISSGKINIFPYELSGERVIESRVVHCLAG